MNLKEKVQAIKESFNSIIGKKNDETPESQKFSIIVLKDGTKISVRPSGTEPKIKFYVEVKGEMGCHKCFDAANAAAEEKVEAVRKSLGI